MSNRLCSRLCCQVPVGTNHGPYLRVAGSCEREVQIRGTDVTRTSLGTGLGADWSISGASPSLPEG